jgi:RNA 3'-terminal phosphate cyclase (ATP)
MRELLTIDGSQGEGGGQILRTTLALSLVTGRAFRIEGIRAGRPKPGLLRQHLTAVQAAARVSGATVNGAELGSSVLTFEPGDVCGGDLELAVGTAGSATLVLQAILPALLLAPCSSRVVLEGGTHNPYAPPFDFLDRTLLPVLRRMGGRVTASLDRHGFYPAGGGRFTVDVEPVSRLDPIDLRDRGPVQVSARALVSGVPEGVAKRELKVVNEQLGVSWDALEPVVVHTSPGPGNALLIAITSEEMTEIVTGFGEKHVGAAVVASHACKEARAYIASDVPVGVHLADQLLVPMALAGGGRFRTLAPSRHTATNAAVLKQFADVDVTLASEADGTCTVTVSHAGSVASRRRPSGEHT